MAPRRAPLPGVAAHRVLDAVTGLSERLVAVAAHGLAGSRTDLPAAPLDEVEWFDLVHACLAADLIGLLAAAAVAGEVPLTPGQADELAVLDSERSGLSLLVDRRTATTAALLDAAGITYRVVDGPARRLAYRDAGVYRCQGVQVLVTPDRLSDALALQGPPPGHGDRVVERLVLTSSLPGLGDLRAPAGHAAPDDAGGDDDLGPDLIAALGSPVTVDLAGRRVEVLGVDQQLVVACAAMATMPVTPLALLRDVAELALSPGLDTLGARRLADSLQVIDALADALTLAWDVFDLADKTELSVWARRMGSARGAGAAAPPAPPSTRPGLAQRMFGRATTDPRSGLTLVPRATTATEPPGTSRPSRSSRR